jgi:hypothetical protein
MQIHPSRLLGVFVVLVAWLAMATAQESYTLEHKFEKGKIYRYSATANSKMTQEMGGQEMHVAMEAWFVPRVSLETVTPEGNFVLVYAADSAKTHIKAPNMDSTMVLANLIGKRSRMTVTPKGEVVKREVIDSVKSDRMLSGIGLRELVRLPRLAAGPVKVGDTWKVTQADTNELGGGKIVTTTVTTYTLAGKEKMQGHDCLKVTFAGAATTAGKGSMMGMELFVEGTGKTSGTFYFDQAKGIFVRNESKTEGETTMAATGQQNMTIPISSTAETTLTLKE